MAYKRKENRECVHCKHLLLRTSWTSGEDPEPICPVCGGPTRFVRISKLESAHVLDDSDGPRRAPSIVGLTEIDYNGKRIPIAEVDAKVAGFNQRMVDEGRPHLVAQVQTETTTTRSDEIRHTALTAQAANGVDAKAKEAYTEKLEKVKATATTAAIANNENPTAATKAAAQSIGSQQAFVAGQ